MPAMTNAHALVVGIANYRHVRSLPTTVLRDARDVAGLLARPDVGGYPAQNVQLLLEGDATLAGVRRALVELSENTDVESTVFIYFTGHGGHIAVEIGRAHV